ncbi:MAG: hypothetical protein AB8C46_24230 [Burkholderiaceae bacterium]
MFIYKKQRNLMSVAMAMLLVTACGGGDDSMDRPAGIGSTHGVQANPVEKMETAGAAQAQSQAATTIGTEAHPFASPAHFRPNMGRLMPAPKKLGSLPLRNRLHAPGRDHDHDPSKTVTSKVRTAPKPSFRAAANTLIGNAPVTHNFTEQCDVNFNDQWALSNVYRQARGNFGEPTTLLPDFTLAKCADVATEACWLYRQRCGTGFYVHVEEPPEDPQEGHIHLSFENFLNQSVCFADPGDGLDAGYGYPQPDGSCLAADWENEPRLVYGHTGAHRIRVWLKEWFSDEPRQFNGVSITVLGNLPANILIKRAGEWYEWESVEPGEVNLSMWAWEITDLYLASADKSNAPVGYDDLVITR